jgi:pyruvate dehydrogenase E2 component (dihydrolipoamide acetyltransferase)
MPEVSMPRLSDTMEEGTIAKWLKQPGDKVEKGEVLAEIETDKAVMELESYDAGVLEQILVPEGETVPIGQAIATVGSGEGGGGAAGGPAPADTSGQSPTQATPAAPSATPAGQAEEGAVREYEAPADKPLPDAGAAAGGNGDGQAAGTKVKASPLARAIAREHGIDLGGISGSGPGGRIVREDVMAVVNSGGAKAAAAPARQVDGGKPAAPAITPAPTLEAGDDDEAIPLTNMRKVVARRLTESMQSTPHFYLTAKIQVDELLALRADLNRRLADEGVKLSVNDLLIKACATAIRLNPGVNVSWGGDKIIKHNRVHMGVAVAVAGGLVVPVIKDADTKTVTQISREAKDLIGKARDQKLKPNEMTGSTFTISNLGMFGVSQFTAVINPPEAGILAVGGSETELYLNGKKPAERTVMRVTLSIDHRALDGASGAQWLQQLVGIIEEPIRILA